MKTILLGKAVAYAKFWTLDFAFHFRVIIKNLISGFKKKNLVLQGFLL